MNNLLQDIRIAFRMLMKKPTFAAIAIATLALGIGANTAIFSVINAALFRPLPFPNEERLVVLQENKTQMTKDDSTGGVSYLNFLDWQANNQLFESMAVVNLYEETLTGEGEPARVGVAHTSSDICKVLGINPLMGRCFKPEEDIAGNSEGLYAVMLGYDCWQKRFEGDRKIVGRNVKIDNHEALVIGVMPAGIFPLQKEPVEFWQTVANGGDAKQQGTMNGSRGFRAYPAALARLKPNVSLAQAQAEMNSIARGLTEKYPENNTGRSLNLTQLRELLIGKARPYLYLLLGIVGAVLLIACANVANLLLARATVRHREIAIRSVLGASRWQIVRQLITESLLLGFAGGVLGVILSLWGIDLLLAFLPENLPRITGLTPDWRVLLFAMATAIFTGVLCGLAPALTASRSDLSEAMKDGGRSSTAGRGNLRHALIVGEIAVALVLLVGAGLLMKSFWRLQQEEIGFDFRNVLTAKVVLPSERYQGEGKSYNFYFALMERVKNLPGVSHVSMAQSIPLTSNDNGTDLEVVGRPVPKGQHTEARLRFIGLDYFETIGIPKLEGRDFTAFDKADSLPVVIINEAFAKQYFKDENPLGKRLKLGWGGDAEKEIIGVFGNVKHRGLDDQARSEMYVPVAQFGTQDMTLLVRTSTAHPEALTSAITAKVREIDPELPVTDIKTLDQYRSDSVAVPRFNTFLLSLFAVLALTLTAIGLYGVISYSVTQRTNEIGIRMALGAGTADILKMILQQGMKLVIMGLGIGLVLALAVTRMMGSLLHNVSVYDPFTFAVVALILFGITLFACFIPALRATKTDPLVSLKYE